jgi:hypothetical protein
MAAAFGKGIPYRRSFLCLPLTLSLKSLRRRLGLGFFASFGEEVSFCVPHSADDAAVFVAPVKEDVQNIASILHHFGEVTGLCTNFSKSSVVPIRCEAIDLDVVLEDIPAARATFPLTSVFRSRFGALGEGIFNTLRISVPESFPHGTESS